MNAIDVTQNRYFKLLLMPSIRKVVRENVKEQLKSDAGWTAMQKESIINEYLPIA